MNSKAKTTSPMVDPIEDSNPDSSAADSMQGSGAMKHVLAVDDSSSMREVVKLTLNMAGFEVTQAKDGVEALTLAQKIQYDLVLTDINMPHMNGIELIKALRALPNYRQTPIVTLTTEKELTRRHEGRAAGATGWIVKPFLPDKLTSTLQRLLK